MFTCSKLYNNLPAAHRQHNHDGHCALIHGHNWAFEITFGCGRLDENGFVVDFGKLKFIRQWLEEQFDHTLLLNEDDPELERLKEVLHSGTYPMQGCFAKIVVVPNCGAEKLAEYVAHNVNELLAEQGLARVSVKKVTCFEDSRNSATFTFL